MPPPPPRPPLRPGGEFIEDLLSGEVVTTPLGQHFETEKVWENHRRHGSVYISDLAELPEDLLHPLSGGAVPTPTPRDGPSWIPKPPAWPAAPAPTPF